MNQDILDSLIGLSVLEAKKQVRESGFKVKVFQCDDIVSSQIRPKTILLWHRGGEVINATAGDPND